MRRLALGLRASSSTTPPHAAALRPAVTVTVTVTAAAAAAAAAIPFSRQFGSSLCNRGGLGSLKRGVGGSSWLPPPPQQQRLGLLTTARPLYPNTALNTPPSITTTTTTTESDPDTPPHLPRLPYRFDTGVALFAKRPPRPFPPPFLSPPSGSFSDALSTHDRAWDRRVYVNGQLIRGFTNGDDAVFASDRFVCVDDGVGAWSTRPRGHAGLWARLILHYWATAVFEDAVKQGEGGKPNPVAYLQRAYEQTVEATSAPNDWQGTTTAAGAQLHYCQGPDHTVEPLLYVTNLGDSQVMVVRPSTRELVFKSTEQWHWFDCPRQLGTNSPDTPATCAVVDEVPIREGDVVLALSDGVIDNLWAHEIVEKVSESVSRWRAGDAARGCGLTPDDSEMEFVAEELMEAAKVIAMDPFAESPFMEHAIEEGLASEGGKMDDISVVAALCRKND
ncbi:phosphatase 2C-like domain-containing protein [Lasiosphaeria hispida]|uniref:Protein phosphatase n=1 Tax=Lasiosphaeria hispida TaxID=260671 RepID=A0AAJ0HU35_9PEZI|nr:phosphatase 2C-like domain-containing protein [Lasiosphaeria hispida]